MSIRESLTRRTGALCLTLSICNGPAQAAAVLDTFAAGATATGPEWAVFGGAEGQALAVRFSMPRAGTIDSAVLALTLLSGEMQVGVAGENGGLPAALFLHETRVGEASANLILSGLSWALPAGDYWLVAAAADESAFGFWIGGSSASAPWAYGSPPDGWISTFNPEPPAARLDLTAIPLPSSMILLAGALFGLAPWRGRQAQ